MKILIVDDSSLIRRSIKSIFCELGFNDLTEAINGKQALLDFDINKPELVTMDINMPGMDGIEVVKKMIENNPKINIIMVSSVNQKNLVFEALQIGARHFIIKPVTIEKIKKVLREVIPDYEKMIDFKHVNKIKKCEIEEVEVQKIDKEYFINVNIKIDADIIVMLNNIIKGLLLVKPLIVCFKINNEIIIKDYLKKELDKLIDMIEINGGKARIEFLD